MSHDVHHFGHNVKVLRKQQGMTQMEVALLAGITESAIGQHERGQRDPLLSHALRVARALGVPLVTLTGQRLSPV